MHAGTRVCRSATVFVFCYLQSTILHLEERGEGVKEMLGSLANWGIREWSATGWSRYRNSEIMQYKGNHSCYFQAQLSRGEGGKERT